MTSSDGTEIVYSTTGSGPPLVYVDGAWCHRGFGPVPKLAPILSRSFTFVSYDRRGRGESGDHEEYSVEREVADLCAVAAAVGAAPVLFGMSSGAVLAMRAAAQIEAKALVMYEAPLCMRGAPGPQQPERMDEIESLVHQGKRSAAVSAFMRMVGVPAAVIPMMRLMPGVWSGLKSVAHTVPYDFAVLEHASASKELPAELERAARAVSVPALLMDGGKSPPWMAYAQDRLASFMATATRRTVAGQDHNVKAKVISPEVIGFSRALAQ